MERNCTVRLARCVDRTMQHLRFSGRTRKLILKAARTIVDLADRETIADGLGSEAGMLRYLDRERVTRCCRSTSSCR